MRFSEMAARLNGVSIAIFGVSWTPPTVDVEVAREVVAFVETRRVLVSTYTNEMPGECVRSVLQIRDFLSEVMGSAGIVGDLLQPLRLIRRYCVRFIQRLGATEDRQDSEGQVRHMFRASAGLCTTTGWAKRSASSAPVWACESRASPRFRASMSKTTLARAKGRSGLRARLRWPRPRLRRRAISPSGLCLPRRRGRRVRPHPGSPPVSCKGRATSRLDPV